MSFADLKRPEMPPRQTGGATLTPDAKTDDNVKTDDRAQINAATVAEASPHAPAPANSAFHARRAYQQAPDPDFSHIRRLPLAGFTWGSSGARPLHPAFRTPRSRGDHCLILMRQGPFRIIIGRKEHRFCAGDVCWLPVGTAFAMPAHPQCDGVVVLISRLIAADCPLPGQPRISHPDPNRFDALWNDTTAMATPGDPRATGLHLGLLSLHLEALPERPPTAFPRPTPQARQDIYPDFCNLARAEMGSGLTLADLASRLGCNCAELDRACQSRRGRRAIEVMNDLRIEMALAMLREGQKTVQQIATRLGFASHAHFCRAITATTGRGPRAFQPETSSPSDSPPDDSL